MDDPSSFLVTLRRLPVHRQCRELGLILDAARIDWRAIQHQGEWLLQVSATDEPRARAELDAAAAENREWSIPSETIIQRASGWGGVLGFAALLLTVAFLERSGAAAGSDWLDVGRMNAGWVRQGQWWRVITALTLHLNWQHLGANLVFGCLFGWFVGQLLGSGLGWFSILIAGALGNGVNAWVQPAAHTAVGASTAVFGALGLLAGHAWRSQVQERRWIRRLTPLVGGVILLSLTGTGGGRTDVIAHLAGFCCGTLLGAVTAALEPVRVRFTGQLCFGGLACAAVAGAWIKALS